MDFKTYRLVFVRTMHQTYAKLRGIETFYFIGIEIGSHIYYGDSNGNGYLCGYGDSNFFITFNTGDGKGLGQFNKFNGDGLQGNQPGDSKGKGIRVMLPGDCYENGDYYFRDYLLWFENEDA